MKKNNALVLILAVGLAALIVVLLFSGGKNQVSSVPAVDSHGHPLTANTAGSTAFKDLLDKSAPNFSLSDRAGAVYSSETLRGKNVVLFFNEGLMCYPSCWNQIVSLAKDERFKNANAVVLSVVVDPPGEWQKAIDKMPELAQAIVVFDQGGAVAQKFGMLTAPSSMHYGSLPGHSYVLIDTQGVIRYIFDDPDMGVRNDQLIEQITKIN